MDYKKKYLKYKLKYLNIKKLCGGMKSHSEETENGYDLEDIDFDVPMYFDDPMNFDFSPAELETDDLTSEVLNVGDKRKLDDMLALEQFFTDNNDNTNFRRWYVI